MSKWEGGGAQAEVPWSRRGLRRKEQLVRLGAATWEYLVIEAKGSSGLKTGMGCLSGEMLRSGISKNKPT